MPKICNATPGSVSISLVNSTTADFEIDIICKFDYEMRSFRYFGEIFRRTRCYTCRRFFSSHQHLPPTSNITSSNKHQSSSMLRRFIIDKIRTTGPITVFEYMQLCQSGYYSMDKSSIFGEHGDFVTSPELTQMFGELIAVWIYFELSHMIAPNHDRRWQLIEVGPGSGQLMNDMLRVLVKYPQLPPFDVHLVEMSDRLMIDQQQLLCASSAAPSNNGSLAVAHGRYSDTIDIYWYRDIADVPHAFSMVVANEFLDALPVHQFRRATAQSDDWREVYIDTMDEGHFRFVLSRGENLFTRALVPARIRHPESGVDVWEVSPTAGLFVSRVAERLVDTGGCALLVDYGHDGDRRDLSLRAYSRHRLVDVLENPGAHDLTADVDFGYLREIVADRLLIFGPIAQRIFLHNMGIDVRLRKLLDKCGDDDRRKQQLIAGYEYLMNTDSGMGERFKVMALYSQSMQSMFDLRNAPAGFVSPY